MQKLPLLRAAAARPGREHLGVVMTSAELDPTANASAMSLLLVLDALLPKNAPLD